MPVAWGSLAEMLRSSYNAGLFQDNGVARELHYVPRKGGESMTLDDMMNTKMGADPEYIIVVNGTQLPANKLFRSSGLAGTDGCSSTGEIRPRPYTDVRLLVEEITGIMQQVVEGIREREPEAKLYAGNYVKNSAIGGHIHISLPSLPMIRKHMPDYNDSIYEEIRNRLNVVMRGLIIPHLEDPTTRKRRENTGYGQVGDAHPVPWGIEYRTPGSWLLSPDVALIYLGLAKMAYQSFWLDVPISRVVKKTIKSLFAEYGNYTEDVRLAIDKFEYMLKNKIQLDWEADISDNWLRK